MSGPVMIKGQPYTPASVMEGEAAAGVRDDSEFDGAPRAYPEVAPGEVEALLRVERAA